MGFSSFYFEFLNGVLELVFLCFDGFCKIGCDFYSERDGWGRGILVDLVVASGVCRKFRVLFICRECVSRWRRFLVKF